MKTVVSGVRLPPEWLPTSSTGPFLGHVAEAADLAAEPEARQQPQARQRLADVVGVALVEVGGGDAAGDEALERAEAAAGVALARDAGDVWVAVAVAGRGGGHARSLPVHAACSRAEPPSGSTRAKKRSSSPFVRSGTSTCGTWPQPSSTTCSALGSQRSTWWRKRSGISRSCEAQTNSAGGCRADEPRIEALAPERRLEVDRPGAGEEGEPCAGRAVDALELVDDDVRHARVDEVAVGEQRPERSARSARGRASGGACRAPGGRSARASASRARTNATAGLSSAIPPTRSGRSRPTSIATRPPMRVADEVGALDLRARPSCRSRPGPRTARRRARSRAWRSRRSRAGRWRGRV